MNRGKVLVVDDDQRWRNTFERFLKAENYSVFLASTYQEAIDALEKKCFHLAIVDIRLVDWDKDNEEGLKILSYMKKKGLTDVIKSIVVTGFGTTDRQRRAFKDYDVVDFIPKEGEEDQQGIDRHEFISLVNQVFDDMEINLGLEISFINDLELEDLADNILADYPIEQSKAELIDILNRLFFDKSHITISPLGEGHSGSSLIEVEPYCNERGRLQPVIVKLGPREEIHRESNHYDQYVHGFIGGGRHTNKERVCYTLHFGGIIYSLLGVTGKYITFSEYFCKTNTENVTAIIKNLFNETCRPWYENRSPKRIRDLQAFYQDQLGFTSENLEQSLQDWFGKWVGQEKIKFSNLDGIFDNPVYCTYASSSYPLPVFVAATHGDLNGNNVLIDANDFTWLIDFYRTSKGHILRDFIELETTVKFELINVSDIKAIYEMETALLKPSHFEELLEFSNSSHNDELAKAFSVIKTLRSLAHDQIRPSNDMREYYVGLFYQTLNLLRYYWIMRKRPKARRRYILLSASMLCKRLKDWE